MIQVSLEGREGRAVANTMDSPQPFTHIPLWDVKNSQRNQKVGRGLQRSQCKGDFRPGVPGLKQAECGYGHCSLQLGRGTCTNFLGKQLETVSTELALTPGA